MDADAILQTAIEEAFEYAEAFVSGGKVASYIPELKKADGSALGICVALPDGTTYTRGEVHTPFTIQSISKVLTLLFSLERYGPETVFDKLGMEPTGDPFNSMIKLETASGKPFNPMINAGAIVTASFIQTHHAAQELLDFIKALTGRDDIVTDDRVYRSEREHGSRNRSMAYLLNSKGLLENDVEGCIDLYFRLCSLCMQPEDLSRIGLVLAFGGCDPLSGMRIIQPWVAQYGKTLMLTCGMYDYSGEFAVRAGIPSKSGVGGGILSCVDGRCGIGVYGPALDEKGNSIGGVKMLEYLSRTLNWHLFPTGMAYNPIVQ